MCERERERETESETERERERQRDRERERESDARENQDFNVAKRGRGIENRISQWEERNSVPVKISSQF